MIIHHHLGLGDHFVCNGLVNYLSKNNPISLICKNKNIPTIQSLYKENQNVNILGIPGLNEVSESKLLSQTLNKDILYIGFDKCSTNNWDRSFYDQLNIDFVERYRFFRLPKTLPDQLDINKKEYIFVHDQSSTHKYYLNIESKLTRYVVNQKDTDNLLSYIGLIQNATEIHCINSSLFHLIDSLSCLTNKLFYHNIRNHPCSFTISPKWNIIQY